ncbi:CWC16 protein [Gaertneriomyces semiglobifer]|nr:CWC16 protein [Gaertneriomyces semiglobifer]
MSERKVLNKYFPPDFDPSKIPRRKLPKDQQHKVRLMTPFSMRCNTCGDYVYKGKKFNARKERVDGENYLGIQIFRFYIKCPKCSAEITFKTDPKNADYLAEHGAQRNFEPWRDEAAAEDSVKAERAQAEENNPMKALENRTLDSKREMDILDALDEIRMRNAKNERVDADNLLVKMIMSDEEQIERMKRAQEEEDDRIAKSLFQSVDGEHVRRLIDDDVPANAIPVVRPDLDVKNSSDGFLSVGAKRKPTTESLGIVIKRKKGPPETPQESKAASLKSEDTQASNALALLGGAYSDSD